MEQTPEYLKYFEAIRRITNERPVIDLVELAKEWDKPWSSFDFPEQAQEWRYIATAAFLENRVLHGEEQERVYRPNTQFESSDAYQAEGKRILQEAVAKYSR